MPGRVFLTSPIAAVAEALGCSVGVVGDEPKRHNIAPGQEIIALAADGLRRMRWGIIPVGRVNARGRPVMETIVNARSETVFDKTAFRGVGRAVMPVNGWYEWTGAKRRKTVWRISPQDGEFLLFAAITDVWTAPGGTRVHQVAPVTCAPSADVAQIHHRMAVILAPEHVPLWLAGAPEQVQTLMVPWPDGRLNVSDAAGVDWSAP